MVGGTYQVFILFLHLQYRLFLPDHQDKIVHVLLTQLKHHCLQVRRVGEMGGKGFNTEQEMYLVIASDVECVFLTAVSLWGLNSDVSTENRSWRLQNYQTHTHTLTLGE